MSEVAVRIRGLSKYYRIGERCSSPMFREALMRIVSSPFRGLRSRLSGKQNGRDHDWIWALRDVNFDLKRGEVIGVIGRNGAGKSTLLKILSGITDPTVGSADLYGRIGSLLEVGTGFHGELTGRENIFMNGAILGMSKKEIRNKFDEILAFSEIEQFIDTPVKHYSSGMYMRLGFAVAAHFEPEILVIDEVLAVGDAAFQKKCLGKIDHVAKEGRTVLFVSHNMTAIKSLCSRTIWLDEGQVKEDGESSYVVSKYLRASAPPTEKERVWDDITRAPGNDHIRVHRMCVRREDGLVSDPITMESPFVIEVEFWNMKSCAQLHINLHLVTEERIVAFSTSMADREGWWTGPVPEGLFRGVCHIPGNLLNSGIHHVTFIAVKDQSRGVYRQEDVLSIEVYDESIPSGGYFYKKSGVVAPILNWTMEQLESQPEVKSLH